MNEKEHKNLLLVVQHCNSFCMNIVDLYSFFNDRSYYQDLTNSMGSMYFRLYGKKAYPSTYTESGFVMMSIVDNPNIFNVRDWSSPIKLEEFDRLVKIKAFW